jgi:hypothetical protein
MTETDARALSDARPQPVPVPGCAAFATDLITRHYRSQAAALKWETSNLISLCRSHHALVHGGKLELRAAPTASSK